MAPGHSGDVAQHIEAAVIGHRRGHQLVAGVPGAHVGDHRMEPSPLADHLDSALQAARVDIAADHHGPLAGQAHGGGPADARSGPGDHGHLP